METTQAKIKLTLTSVYDSKVKQHQHMMPVRTIDEALRSFGAGAKKEGHEFKDFASDFSLWVLGYYYPETGVIEPTAPMQIASATEFTTKQ